MKNRLLVTISLALAAWVLTSGAAFAQTATGGSSSQVPILTHLASTLDSSKRKAGDEIELKVAKNSQLPDGTKIAEHSKIIGHITEAKARSKGDSESSLGIVFDKIELKGGKTMGISGLIRAVGPTVNEQQGGVDYGGSMNQATQHMGGGSSNSPASLVTEQSQGIQGIKDLKLSSDGALHSDGKAVKLDADSQILILAKVAGD